MLDKIEMYTVKAQINLRRILSTEIKNPVGPTIFLYPRIQPSFEARSNHLEYRKKIALSCPIGTNEYI